jgi:hypothetical protein
MLARGSHNIILFNLCNKFSIELTLIQYPLYIICIYSTEEPPETIEMKDMSNNASKHESQSTDHKMDTQPDTHSERSSRKHSSENSARRRKTRRTGKCIFYNFL